MKEIQIPEDYLQAFEFIGNLPEEEAQRLGNLVKNLPFKMDPEGFANLVYEVFPASQDFDLGEAIFSLGSVMNREEIELDQLIQSLDADFKKKNGNSIQQNLKHVLADAHQLKHVFKAYSLQRETERLLTKASVFTDVRFCFEEDLDKWKADHGVIVHNLKIEFLGSNGKADELFVGLDREDLEKLIEAAQRALSKEVAIKKQYSGEISWFN